MLLRLSTLFVRTLREDPADAEVASHKLLVRAGYIRRAAPGIYTWLPLGLRVLAPVAAAGSMALTLYVAHAIVLAVVGLATVHHDRWTVPDWLLPTLVIGALVVAPLWRRFVGMGPLEAGLRSISGLARTRRPSATPI